MVRDEILSCDLNFKNNKTLYIYLVLFNFLLLNKFSDPRLNMDLKTLKTFLLLSTQGLSRPT